MKKVFFVLILFFLICITANASGVEAYIQDELKILDSEIEGFSFADFLNQIENGITDLSDMDLPEKIFAVLSGELYKCGKLILSLIIPVVLFSLLSNMSLNTENSVVMTAHLVLYAIIAAVAVYVFNDIIALAENTLVEINTVTKCIVPVLFTLYAYSGNAVGAAFVKPALFITSQLFGDVILKFFFPLTTISFALNLTDNILGTGRRKYFGDLISRFTKWSMVFSVTLYMMLVTAANMAGEAMGGLKLKSAKFAVATFVPVVGGILADGVETVVASFKMIKGALGITGIIGILYIAVIPVVKIFIVVFLFWLTASVTEPLGERKPADLLHSIGNTIGIVGTLVVCNVFVFLVFSAVIMSGGT